MFYSWYPIYRPRYQTYLHAIRLLSEGVDKGILCLLFRYRAITVTSQWARWGLKSPASPLFTYSAVYSGAVQRKHQSSASLAFVPEIHRGPVNSPHKRPVTRKMFTFDDVIMAPKEDSLFGPIINQVLCQWIGSSLIEVKTCRLFDISHYMSQCWLAVYWTLRNSTE